MLVRLVALVAFIGIIATPTTASASAHTWSNESFFPAGDMDGDGRDDVVGKRLLYDSQHQPVGAVATAYSGADGLLLWTETLDDVGVSVVPTRISDGGAYGVLLIHTVDHRQDIGDRRVWAVRTIVTALDGSGALRWRRVFATGSTCALLLCPSPGTSHPFRRSGPDAPFEGLLQTPDDRPERVVIGIAGPSHWNEAAAVIDLATGAPVAVIARPAGAALVSARPAPDVTGDGFGEVGLSWSTADGELGFGLWDGDSGARLWEQKTATRLYPLRGAVGDVNNDGVDEIVALSRQDSSSLQQGTLLSGLDGEVFWQRRLDGALPLGDVDRDGAVDVLTYSGHHGYLHYEAVDASGAVAKAATFFGSGNSWPDVERAGDVNGDGLQDVVHTFSAGDSEGEVVSALEPLSSTWANYVTQPRPLGASLDGAGDDIVNVARGRVEAHDGRTGDLLWMSYNDAWRVTTSDYDGAGPPDVFTTGTGGAYGISGADGTILWHIPRTIP